MCDIPLPQSLSRRVYPHNFVGQILKIFECLGLKSNSCTKNVDKFTKILLKKFTNLYGKLFRKLVKNGMSKKYYSKTLIIHEAIIQS